MHIHSRNAYMAIKYIEYSVKRVLVCDPLQMNTDTNKLIMKHTGWGITIAAQKNIQNLQNTVYIVILKTFVNTIEILIMNDYPNQNANEAREPFSNIIVSLLPKHVLH